MSSSTNNNSINGSSQALGTPSTSSSRGPPARNGNTGDQVESPSNRASTSHLSQGEDRPGTSSYTGLMSQNGSFGDQFWRVNDGGHSGDHVADSKAWSTTANKSTESVSKETGTKNQGNADKVGEAAETK